MPHGLNWISFSLLVKEWLIQQSSFLNVQSENVFVLGLMPCSHQLEIPKTFEPVTCHFYLVPGPSNYAVGPGFHRLGKAWFQVHQQPGISLSSRIWGSVCLRILPGLLPQEGGSEYYPQTKSLRQGDPVLEKRWPKTIASKAPFRTHSFQWCLCDWNLSISSKVLGGSCKQLGEWGSQSFFLFFFLFLVTPLSMQDLSSPAKDWTRASCSESMES